MKSIIYILTVIVTLGGILSPATLQAQKNKHRVTLRPVESVDLVHEMYRAASVIEDRMKQLGMKNVTAVVSDHDTSIVLTYKAPGDQSSFPVTVIEDGGIGFYRCYTQAELMEMLGADHPLFGLLDDPVSAGGVVGSGNPDELAALLGRLTMEHGEGLHLRFAWDATQGKDGKYGLYALDTGEMLGGSAVEKATVEDEHGYPALMLEFNGKGTDKWAELTRENVMRNIAIVVDDKVVSAPMVQQEIKGGKAMITGNFSREELVKMAALIQSGPLPVQLEPVEMQ